ncbi:MAG: hypothetical protein WBG42_08365, partial [Cryomorphaceae bacterium]
MRALPQQAQGYLIWDSIPGMDYVNVDIVKRTYVNDSLYSESTLEKIQVWNNHFLRIDKQYWGHDQTMAVNVVIISA